MLWLVQTDVRHDKRPWKMLTRTLTSYVTTQGLLAEVEMQLMKHMMHRLIELPGERLRMGMLLNLVPPLGNESCSVGQANSDLETMLTGQLCLLESIRRSQSGLQEAPGTVSSPATQASSPSRSKAGL